MTVVSVVMPCYNAESFIAQAIESVISQTFTKFELIVVDNMSVDSSVEIIKKYMARDCRIKLLSNTKSRGAAATRNLGIEEAKGRYIAFLDSDDLWMPRKLEFQIALMDSRGIPFTFTSYSVIDTKGKLVSTRIRGSSIGYLDLLKTNLIGCLTVVYDTEYFGKQFMSTKTKREDYALWLNLLKNISSAVPLIEVLASYRIHPTQSSSSKLDMAKENWRLYRYVEGLSFWRACYYFLHYAWHGISETLRAKSKV